jgi:hypothetical protein
MSLRAASDTRRTGTFRWVHLPSRTAGSCRLMGCDSGTALAAYSFFSIQWIKCGFWRFISDT